jgi:hypothetical protein
MESLLSSGHALRSAVSQTLLFSIEVDMRDGSGNLFRERIHDCLLHSLLVCIVRLIVVVGNPFGLSSKQTWIFLFYHAKRAGRKVFVEIQLLPGQAIHEKLEYLRVEIGLGN